MGGLNNGFNSPKGKAEKENINKLLVEHVFDI
jgi:hypothetical protein